MPSIGTSSANAQVPHAVNVAAIVMMPLFKIRLIRRISALGRRNTPLAMEPPRIAITPGENCVLASAPAQSQVARCAQLLAPARSENGGGGLVGADLEPVLQLVAEARAAAMQWASYKVDLLG